MRLKLMRDRFVRSVFNWVDISGRGFGMIAFVLNRVTGLGLVLYLILHFMLLSLLAAGQGGWNMFIAVAKSPLFLGFDLLLFAGLLIHGLNGIRLTLVGFGVGVGAQRTMFLVAMTASFALILLIAVWLFGGA
jgi:succinate dehydrogenase / fumarate reductase, cytochrome b subunit